MKKRSKTAKIVINVILTLLTVVWVFPLIFAVFTSFKSKQDYALSNFWDWPKANFLLDNFQYVQDNADLLTGMLNSLLYSFALHFSVWPLPFSRPMPLLICKLNSVCFGFYLFTAEQFFHCRSI